ncbi:hypothetical protein K9N68_10275 [Kovacikia minuta CCNUW1]|uniref:hypothetical protein n=1 Tax=Kovacikia minuta TaxID=2931930 RepID=UPI001CCBEFAF|nr:hypothetical protein [Kovacikia minuta]UBF28225.1 hypothetical protein K9N68_10275 [Kovacikia minuta CCNUW1]
MECKAKKYFSVEVDFELDFCTHEAKIYTTNSFYELKALPSELSAEFSSESGELGAESSSNEKAFLVIEVWTQLDDTESFKNVLLNTRTPVLILLSVISYLLDHPLTIYEVESGETGIALDEKPNKIKVSKFIHSQVDKSDDLIRILEAIYESGESVNEFLVSVLSRWHKARYLEEQGDASLYYEESFLVYFHVIELCSNHYSNQQSKEAQDQIERFTRELLSNTLKLRDNQLEQVSQEKYKAVRSILLADGQISITSKTCYFLDQVKLLDLKTQYFVEQLVKIRNTIAHGRPVNHKTLNWPLPPFFSINGDVENFIFEIRAFTGRVIGAYLSIEVWMDKWSDVHDWLHVPPEYIRKFISDDSFKSIAPTDFLKGTIDGVRPSSLVKQFLSNRMKFHELEIGLKSFLFDVKVDEDSAFEVFEAAIVLADSSDKQLSDRCRSIVSDIHRNELVWYSNIKDVLREIEQQGVKLVWFREWIETGGHRS